MNPFFLNHFIKVMPFCSPTDQNEDCLKRILKAESGCLDSCSGLHADVVHRDDKGAGAFHSAGQSKEG